MELNQKGKESGVSSLLRPSCSAGAPGPQLSQGRPAQYRLVGRSRSGRLRFPGAARAVWERHRLAPGPGWSPRRPQETAGQGLSPSARGAGR